MGRINNQMYVDCDASPFRSVCSKMGSYLMQTFRLKHHVGIMAFRLLILVLLFPTNYVIADELQQAYSIDKPIAYLSYSSVAFDRLSPKLDGSVKAADKSFIVFQLYDDLAYLLSEPDFYGIVGGLGLAPSALPSAFKNESPEFTELWSPSTFADHFFEIGDLVGNGTIPVFISATSWGIGKIARSHKFQSFGTDLIRVQAMNGIFTAILKGSVNRTRPDGTPYSYPSGHTSSAFATAGVVYSHFGKTWGIPAYLLAGYVGLSRLQEGKHYLSDVIAGGILGTYVSIKLVKKGRKNNSLSISPIKAGNGIGMSLSYRF